jgi:hypothetical protein
MNDDFSERRLNRLFARRAVTRAQTAMGVARGLWELGKLMVQVIRDKRSGKAPERADEGLRELEVEKQLERLRKAGMAVGEPER